jgi:hypothetical protein
MRTRHLRWLSPTASPECCARLVTVPRTSDRELSDRESGAAPHGAGRRLRADLNDLSQGLIRSRLSAHVRAVRVSIDVGIFVTRTVPRAIVRHLIRAR